MRDFLQSEEWRRFQENFGRKTFFVNGEDFEAGIIEHKLPLLGKYFYIPGGFSAKAPLPSGNFKNFFQKIVALAKKEKIGWIRLDVPDEKSMDLLKSAGLKIQKAPHDMQPREIFTVDITKPEEQLLAEMKAKTRYNVKLAEKKNVSLDKNKDIEEFLRLTKIMAKRQRIATHPEEYYRKMLETIPRNILKLYAAEYRGKIIAADLVVFYGKTAIYLHGASDDEYRNVMAPHLLKWREILDAKKAGCEKFDFGGIKTQKGNTPSDENSWAGITKFKLGFSTVTAPTKFLGSYDAIINPARHRIYKTLQKVKSAL